MQDIKFLSGVTLLNEATYIEDKSKIDIGLIVLNSLTKEILFNLFRLNISICCQCQEKSGKDNFRDFGNELGMFRNRSPH